MTAYAAVPRAVLPSVWRIHLTCGHDVEVPWGASAPAQMACVLRHQTLCVEPVESLHPAWMTLPSPRPVHPEGP